MKRSLHDKYKVNLTEKELQVVSRLIKKGICKAQTIIRARILVAAAEGKFEKENCSARGTVRSTVHNTWKKYAEQGLQRAQPSRISKKEAVAIACTKAPKGYVRWTLMLLTEEVYKKLHVSIGSTVMTQSPG